MAKEPFPFKTILARAEKRKGGPAGLKKLLPAKPNAKALEKLGDDRILAEMTKRVFSAGFAWSVIEQKWPGFEQAFLGFKPAKLTFQPDDFWHDLLSDTGIVRNGAKINSVRGNAAFVQEIAKEHGSFGKFLAKWPSSDEIGLLNLLNKRGSRLGGNTGMMFCASSAGMVSSPRRMSWPVCATQASIYRRRSNPRATSPRCRRSSTPGPGKPGFLMFICRGSARCRSAKTTRRADGRDGTGIAARGRP